MPGTTRGPFLILLGPPGSGKGTLSRLLQERDGWKPISTGEEIRKRMAIPGDEIGESSTPYMDRGDYIPDDLALRLFHSIASELEPEAKVVLDGFPRSVPQAEHFWHWLKTEQHPFSGCIFLEVDPEVAAERMRQRRVCPSCRKTFPAFAGDPTGEVCDECGDRLIPREDDDPERMARRVQKHEQVTRPLRNWFQERNQLIELDASQTPEQLLQEILQR